MGGDRDRVHHRDLDLADFGTLQTLTPTDVVLSDTFGPDLSPLRRAHLDEFGITVFTWTATRGEESSFNIGVVFPNGNQVVSGGYDVPTQPETGQTIDDGTGQDNEQVTIWTVRADTAFVTVTVGDQTWVQQPVSGLVALVLPPGPAQFTEYAADGNPRD